MAEFSNSGFEEEGSIDLALAMDGAPTKKESAEFVAVDIGNLSVLADKEANSSPRVIKSFSRKGTQRTSEKKAAEGDATTAHAVTSGAHTSGKIAVTGHVTVIEEAVLPPFPASATPTSTMMTTKMRRLGSSGRRRSPWLDPRKVMFFFATVSSIGTLVLLYFTLSMGKMTGGGDEAGAV